MFLVKQRNPSEVLKGGRKGSFQDYYSARSTRICGFRKFRKGCFSDRGRYWQSLTNY